MQEIKLKFTRLIPLKISSAAQFKGSEYHKNQHCSECPKQVTMRAKKLYFSTFVLSHIFIFTFIC